MSTKLIVDGSSQLQEVREISHQPRNPVLRVLAKIFSYVFHPLFVPVYLIFFFIWSSPHLFAGLSPMEKGLTPIRFFVTYTLFPLVTVLLAKGLGFLDSVFLRTQKERIIPYIACGVFYFFSAYVFRNQPQFPRELVQLTMGIFIASSLGLIANIYMKVSMHAISMGIMVFFVALLAATQPGNYTTYLSVAILLAGLVCTARLIVSDHSPAEIYTGFLVGAGSLLLGVWADGFLP